MPIRETTERAGDTAPLNVLSVGDADDNSDEHGTADDCAGGNAHRSRHDTQKLMSFHRTLPFAFVDRAPSRSSTGKTREKHNEGRTHKATTPVCI